MKDCFSRRPNVDGLSEWDRREEMRKYFEPRWKRDPVIGELLPRHGCAICSLYQERLDFDSRDPAALGTARLEKPTTYWPDVLSLPVAAGWHFKSKRFRWFGQEIKTVENHTYVRDKRECFRSTMSVILADLRTYLEREFGEECVPIQHNVLPPARTNLMISEQTGSISAPVYLVNDKVGIAVAQPRRKRGRTEAREFFNASRFSLDADTRYMSVVRTQPSVVNPCQHHSAKLMESKHGGMLGQVLNTQVPDPIVWAHPTHYNQLRGELVDRICLGKRTLVILEGAPEI